MKPHKSNQKTLNGHCLVLLLYLFSYHVAALSRSNSETRLPRYTKQLHKLLFYFSGDQKLDVITVIESGWLPVQMKKTNSKSKRLGRALCRVQMDLEYFFWEQIQSTSIFIASTLFYLQLRCPHFPYDSITM